MAISADKLVINMSGLSGGPTFSTDIIVGRNGQEVRNAGWQDALWEYNAAYAVRTRADAIALRNFFLNRIGREQAFLLQAGDDYKIPDTGSTPAVIATGNGSTTTFQIKKPYVDSLGGTYLRTILRPSEVSSDFHAFVNGSPASVSGYNAAGGTFTLSSAPGVGTSVGITLAKFYTVCRFDIDKLDIDMLTWWIDNTGADTSLHQIPSIPLKEVRDTV